MESLDAVVASVEAALAGPCGVPAGQPLVAACSGGADSVALVAALAALAPRWPLVTVAFVDHGRREIGAEREAAAAAAHRAGVPFRALTLTVPAHGNLQAQARDARYAALHGILEGDALLATGHTATDQAETVLQRLVRGAGLRGLAAIAPREGAVVRPLLAVSRAETRALGLPFADDPSNATGAYLRNRLRHEVLPLLVAENPQVEQALAAVARHARAELGLIDALADALDLAAADFRGVPSELVAALVQWRHRREVGGAPPSSAAVAALAAQLTAGAPRGAVSLGRAVMGRARAGRLSFERAHDRRLEVVVHGPGTYRLPTLALALELALTPTAAAGDDGLPIVASLRHEGLQWPLTISRDGAVAGRRIHREPVPPEAPHPPSPSPSPTGAPTPTLMICDALGARVWPAPPLSLPAGPYTGLWLRVRARATRGL